MIRTNVVMLILLAASSISVGQTYSMLPRMLSRHSHQAEPCSRYQQSCVCSSIRSTSFQIELHWRCSIRCTGKISSAREIFDLSDVLAKHISSAIGPCGIWDMNHFLQVVTRGSEGLLDRQEPRSSALRQAECMMACL